MPPQLIPSLNKKAQKKKYFCAIVVNLSLKKLQLTLQDIDFYYIYIFHCETFGFHQNVPTYLFYKSLSRKQRQYPNQSFPKINHSALHTWAI